MATACAAATRDGNDNGLTLRLAGEIAARSFGSAATAMRGTGKAADGVNDSGDDKDKDINGNGLGELEERPAPVTEGE